MDFDEGLIKERGYGIYERMDVDCLPPFWLAYLADPSDSGALLPWLHYESTVHTAWFDIASMKINNYVFNIFLCL